MSSPLPRRNFVVAVVEVLEALAEVDIIEARISSEDVNVLRSGADSAFCDVPA